MNDIRESQKLPVVLFPGAYLEESSLKMILTFFGPLTIFQPWYMDREVFSSEKDVSSVVRVLNPPEDLKPTERLRRTLADFKQWMDVNPDKGYTAFLSAGGLDQGPEDSTWAIRKALRQARDPHAEAELPPVLKWHLVLHLAQEIEDDKQEAETALKALRGKDSPLKGTVENEGTENLFYDLPGFGKETVMPENRLLQVYEAWFSLYGGLLKDHALLTTTNHQVMDHISGIWQEHVMGEDENAEMDVSFRVPDLSHLSLEDLLGIKARALTSPVLNEVRNTILGIWKDPKGQITVLKKRAEEIARAFPEGAGKGSLWITLNYLKPGAPPKMRDLWRQFSGKSLILVSKEGP
jgi:hypothetical protein